MPLRRQHRLRTDGGVLPESPGSSGENWSSRCRRFTCSTSVGSATKRWLFRRELPLRIGRREGPRDLSRVHRFLDDAEQVSLSEHVSVAAKAARKYNPLQRGSIPHARLAWQTHSTQSVRLAMHADPQLCSGYSFSQTAQMRFFQRWKARQSSSRAPTSSVSRHTT
jgi:hypothetical protein